jgi:hypothetical protein
LYRAEEVGNDLDILPEEARKKGGFGASVVDGPGSACAFGQANIALRTHAVAQQECGVSRWWRNKGRSGRGRDFLRHRVGDRAECTCEHESGYVQLPNSRNLVHMLINVGAHLFVLQFSVFGLRM